MFRLSEAKRVENLFIFQSFNFSFFIFHESSPLQFDRQLVYKYYFSHYDCLGKENYWLSLYSNPRHCLPIVAFINVDNVETDLFLKVGKEATDGKIFVL